MESDIKGKSGFRVIVVFVLFTLMGLAVTPLLNVKLVPEEGLQRFYITYRLPNSTPRVVESSVTSRLEGIVASLNGVAGVESESRMGSGEISIELNRFANPEKFRIALSMAIRQVWANFPEEATYPEISTRSLNAMRETAMLTYRVESQSSDVDLSVYLSQSLIPHLYRVSGLKSVQVDGLYNLEAHIIVDKHKAEVLNLSSGQIVNAIRGLQPALKLSNVSITNIDEEKQYSIEISLGKGTVLNLDQLFVETDKGEKVALSQLATIQLRRTNENQIFRVNGVDNVYLRLYADMGENHLDLAKKVRNVLAEYMQQNKQSVNIYLVSDSTEFISREIRSIAIRTLLTLLLLMLATWVIYRDNKYLLIIAISLVVNVCISFLVFYLYRLEVHFFAMAGITLSLGLMIDNSIVVIDYLRKTGHKRILIPLLAANLTTIGALLSISVFSALQEGYWQQFTAVVTVCLSVSFVTALFLIPALVRKFNLRLIPGRSKVSIRKTQRLNKLYCHYINWSVKRKGLVITIFVLAFGTPFFLLPSKIEDSKPLAKVYNGVFAGKYFSYKVRPVLDKLTGGTLRPFVTKALASYTSRIPQEKRLYIQGVLQKEYTALHLNRQVWQLEQFFLEIEGIQNLQVEVSPNRRASISISFSKASHANLPFNLMDEVAKYLEKFGGGTDWSISYDNLNKQITHGITRNQSWGYNLYGYNFDELLRYAVSECDSLLRNPRIVNPKLKSRFSFFTNNSEERQNQFVFYPNVPQNARREVVSKALDLDATPMPLGYYRKGETTLMHYLSPNISTDSYYNLFNQHHKYGNSNARLSNLGYIEKVDVPLEIVRQNQQYQLHISFGFMGSGEMAVAFEKEQIRKFNQKSVPGFRAANKFNDSNSTEPNLLGTALLIVIIIFFITSILFESLRQALWVIVMIPFSYIGIFLTFSIFNIDFDQGGYAAFVLLSGITVNAALYLVSAFNNTRQTLNDTKRYIKAWNTMIVPIVLTIISTILGFIPFLIKGSEVFWKALAAGVIGGLFFSVIVIALVLPIALVRYKCNLR